MLVKKEQWPICIPTICICVVYPGPIRSIIHVDGFAVLTSCLVFIRMYQLNLFHGEMQDAKPLFRLYICLFKWVLCHSGGLGYFWCHCCFLADSNLLTWSCFWTCLEFFFFFLMANNDHTTVSAVWVCWYCPVSLFRKKPLVIPFYVDVSLRCLQRGSSYSATGA